MKNNFQFHGGAASYLGVGIIATLISVCSLFILFPWSLCMIQGWKINNTTYKGKKLQFTGTGFGLIGLWIKWWFFTMITFGIYTFWIMPSLQGWIWKNTIIIGDE